MTITVWVDGSGNTGGPAGVGWYAKVEALGLQVFYGEGSLPLANATNQQAELLAAAYALHELPEGQDVIVVSDSEYVVLGWNEYPERRRKTNLTHWDRLTAAVARHRSVLFRWVKGHDGDEGNERADQLAGEARARAKAAA